jgi:hypothetical protein
VLPLEVALGKKSAKEAREILAKKLAAEINTFNSELPKGKVLSADEAKARFFAGLSQELKKGISVFEKLEKLEKGELKKVLAGLPSGTPSKDEVLAEVGLNNVSGGRSVFSLLSKAGLTKNDKAEESETPGEDHLSEETSSPGKHPELSKSLTPKELPVLEGKPTKEAVEASQSKPPIQTKSVFMLLRQVSPKPAMEGEAPDFGETSEDYGPRGQDSVLPLDKEPAKLEGDQSGEGPTPLGKDAGFFDRAKAWVSSKVGSSKATESAADEGPIPKHNIFDQVKTKAQDTAISAPPSPEQQVRDHFEKLQAAPHPTRTHGAMLGQSQFAVPIDELHTLSAHLNSKQPKVANNVMDRTPSPQVPGTPLDPGTQAKLAAGMQGKYVPAPKVALGSEQDTAGKGPEIVKSGDLSLKQEASLKSPTAQQPKPKGLPQSGPTLAQNQAAKMGLNSN